MCHSNKFIIILLEIHHPNGRESALRTDPFRENNSSVEALKCTVGKKAKAPTESDTRYSRKTESS
jgi:hypothetical protein